MEICALCKNPTGSFYWCLEPGCERPICQGCRDRADAVARLTGVQYEDGRHCGEHDPAHDHQNCDICQEVA